MCVAASALSEPIRATSSLRGFLKEARTERGRARTRAEHPIGRWQNCERCVRGHDPTTDRTGHTVSPQTHTQAHTVFTDFDCQLHKRVKGRDLTVTCYAELKEL